ncbi:MAG: NifU family protein [Saprospiraceae bacterium]|nr:NifU family protein [Saprospiraceae bacterium]MCB9324847.1 NifU family protein [Lewinellaceae bacterium]
MENKGENRPLMLYSEQTPNPETLKFVTNRMLHNGTADFNTVELAEEWSPLAKSLFDQPYVKGVYISNNYVTITKEINYSWEDIMLVAKEFIKNYLNNNGAIINEGFADAQLKMAAEREGDNYTGRDAEIVTKIKDLIETYVKPAVEMDGGNIAFKGYDQGRVTVLMQGSCSGCPSSTMTLKAGIEGMLQRMIPEVKEVVAEAG